MAPFGDEVHVGPEIEDIYYIAQGFRSIFFDQHFFLLIRLTRPLEFIICNDLHNTTTER